MNLVLPEAALTLMREAARSGYPEECCGALLGHAAGDDRIVLLALPISNERDSERRTRYLIGPDEYRAADATARQHDCDVVGFFHSHPDHPAVPSAFDREHAWPWYAYVIVPVQAGEAGAARAWRLAEDRAAFHEMNIALSAVVEAIVEEAT